MKNRMLRHVVKAFVTAAITTGAAQASECPIVAGDLTVELQRLAPGGSVSTMQSVDPGSEVPVRHYAVVLNDGSLLALGQEHCDMYDISVTLISAEPEPSQDHLGLMAEAVALTPTAQRWFPDDAAEALRSEFASARFRDAVSEGREVTYVIDDRLAAVEENSEALLSITRLGLPDLPYGSILSIHIAVGGL